MRAPATNLLLVVLGVGLLLGWLWLATGAATMPLQYPADDAQPLPPLSVPGGQSIAVPEHAPRVSIEMTPRAKLLLPAPPSFSVRAGERELDWPVRVLAGAAAELLGPVRRAGRSLVRIDVADGSAHVRAVQIDEPTAVTVVPFGGPVTIAGRVVDAAGKPVAKASIWSGELRAGALVTVNSGEDGRFEARAPAGSGIPLVVSKAGLASAHRFVARAVAASVDDELFVLDAECTLAVSCLAVADDLSAAAVAIVPLDAGETALQQYPFFLQAVTGWLSLGRDGRGLVHGLPHGVRVGVVVRHPQMPISPPAVADLMHARADVAVQLHLLPAVTGRVVGGDQRPVAEATLLVRSRREPTTSRGDLWLLPADAFASGVVEAAVGRDGSFAIGNPGDASATLAVLAAGRCGLEFGVGPGRGVVDSELVLPDVAAGPPEVRVPPPGDGPWLVRCRPQLPSFVPVAAGAAFTLPLPAPLLVDLTVTTEREGTAAVVHRLGRVAIVGTFTLPLPPR